VKNALLIVVLTVILTILVIKTWFSGDSNQTPTIPTIVTLFDTVETVPKWLNDSIKKWKKIVHTTDTVNLVIQNTLIDTVFVPVNAPAEERPNLWPLLEYHGGASFGDTAIVTTFSVQTGQGAVSRIFIPGILTDVTTGASNVPQLRFEPFPKRKGATVFQQLKLFGLGFGSCSLLQLVIP